MGFTQTTCLAQYAFNMLAASTQQIDSKLQDTASDISKILRGKSRLHHANPICLPLCTPTRHSYKGILLTCRTRGILELALRTPSIWVVGILKKGARTPKPLTRKPSSLIRLSNETNLYPNIFLNCFCGFRLNGNAHNRNWN